MESKILILTNLFVSVFSFSVLSGSAYEFFLKVLKFQSDLHISSFKFINGYLTKKDSKYRSVLGCIIIISSNLYFVNQGYKNYLAERIHFTFLCAFIIIICFAGIACVVSLEWGSLEYVALTNALIRSSARKEATHFWTHIIFHISSFAGKHFDESFGLKKWQEKAYILMTYFVPVTVTASLIQCILLFDEDNWSKLAYSFIITYGFAQICIQGGGIFVLFVSSLCKIMSFFDEYRWGDSKEKYKQFKESLVSGSQKTLPQEGLRTEI